ncbi:hypothetical protein DYB37_002416 [Aphanomyces astaci]|uniref:Phosphoglycerate mutase n=1 Tax=Aphanomyces astaci TaxID=112090 RepID=A0A3R7CQM9_APHAT|nr:hypothetical protein DYB35_003389 [Aphanomyces astaci]RHZ33567.1 hypothetical protein DYB37_002416 [Aphanomyces astaci]
MTASAMTFRSLDGFFAYEAATAEGINRPASKLFDQYTRIPTSWHAFRHHISSLAISADAVKVLYFIRHAEGHHNAAEKHHGTTVWDHSVSKQDAYLDAELNAAGIADASKRSISMRGELDAGMPLDRILVSPLTRTVQTANLYFNLTPPTTSQVPVHAIESARETLGVHTCDKRRPTASLEADFPHIDWSRIEPNVDILWHPSHRETTDEIHARCRDFLREVFHTVPDTYLAVVSHGGFIQACMDVLGMPSYKPANCEVVPVVVAMTSALNPINNHLVEDDDDISCMSPLLLAIVVVVIAKWVKYATMHGR